MVYHGIGFTTSLRSEARSTFSSVWRWRSSSARFWFSWRATRAASPRRRERTMCFAWENHLQLDENFKDLGEFPSGESILKESKGKFEFEMSFWHHSPRSSPFFLHSYIPLWVDERVLLTPSYRYTTILVLLWQLWLLSSSSFFLLLSLLYATLSQSYYNL